MVGDDKLILNLGWDGARIAGVTVASSRRPEVSRVLEGKTPEQAGRMVPLLFSLCGRAQETAAALALETALGQSPNGEVLLARERRVLGEAAMEYLWRILADWPSLIGEAPEMETLAQIRSRLRQAGENWQDFSQRLESFLEQKVLSMAPSAWQEMGNVELWAEEGKTVAARVVRQLMAGEGAFGDGGVALMPLPETHGLLREIEPALRDQGDFPARPTWAGVVRETGALARTAGSPLVDALRKQGGNSVALRFVARLVELTEMPERLRKETDNLSWLGAASPRPNWGLAWVECARGLLLHQAQVEEGRVVRYRIVAPTEWNFHPDGPLVRGLQGVMAASEGAARSKATAMVQALDPCVAYEIEVYHA